MRLVKSTAIIGAMTLLSRVLGLVRDILLAACLGAGLVNDALITAIKLPNLFRRMFAEGAFNAAFVPLYARRLEGDGEEVAAKFAGEAFSALFFLVALIVVLFQLTMPISLNLIGGGLNKVATGPDGLIPYDLAVLYARLTMPYLLLMSIGALFSGMLNTKNFFAVAAFVPALLNFIWIGILITPYFIGLPPEKIAIYLAMGMTVSGVFQVAFLIFALRKAGMALPLKWPKLTPDVKRLFTLGVPGLFAAGITQLNLLVTHNIATLQPGAPSWLYYSDRLYQLPLGMIGIALGIALLPSLARSLRANRDGEAMTTLNRATEIAAFLTLPAMFALGLPAFVLIKILTPTFFARENTKTPMMFAILSAVINVVLGFFLFFTIGFYGLALATTLAGWSNVVCLAIAQKRRGHFKMDGRLLRNLPKILLATLLMGGVLVFLEKFAQSQVKGSMLWDYLILLIICSIGGFIYVCLAALLRIFNLGELKASLRKPKA